MISVIVPTKSHPATFISIGKQSAKHELIVERHGTTPGDARNRAAKKARGITLVFLDDDCHPLNNDWLKNLTKRGGVTSGRIIQPTSFMGNLIGRMGGLGTPDFGAEPKLLTHVPATNLAVPRKLFDSLGGFNPKMVVGEDIEFCDRLAKDGQHINYESSAVVVHKQKKVFRRAYHGAKHTSRQSMMKKKTLVRLGILPSLLLYAGLCVVQPLLLLALPLGLLGLGVKYSIYAPAYVYHLICESAGAWRGVI